METVVLFHNEEGDLETEKDAYSITKAEFLPVSPATQTVIRPATVSGPDMRLLMKIVCHWQSMHFLRASRASLISGMNLHSTLSNLKSERLIAHVSA